MDDACRQRTGNLAKGARSENSAWGQELSVIEQVKELAAELEIKTFADPRVLNQRKVPIVYARPVEESPPSVPFKTYGRRRECRGIEILASGISRVLNNYGAHLIGGVNGKNNGTTECGPQQGMVVRFNQRNGKARRESCDPTDRPSVRQRRWSPQFVDRQTIVEAGDEIVSGVER